MTDEKLIDEKFKSVYKLFENKFDVISTKLDEVIGHQKITNSRVNKLEASKLLADRDNKDVVITLNKLNVTLKEISKRTTEIEDRQDTNSEEHEDINEKLEDIEDAIADARKKGIRFWLWFSENKIRIIIILLVLYVMALPSLQNLFMQVIIKLIGKI